MLAGKLKERFAFDKRTTADDGYGNTQSDWAEQFTVWARKRYLVGGENVVAARLAGHAPVVVSVRSSSQTQLITTDWRCRDTRTEEVFNIRAVTPTEKRGGQIDFLVETGVAEG